MRQGKVDGILQGVGVLIFVHQNGGVAPADDPAQRGAAVFAVHQQIQRQMLKIGVIQLFFGAFGGKAFFGKQLRHPHKGCHQRGGGCAVLLPLQGGTQDAVGAQRRQLLFGAVAQFGHRQRRGVGILAALDAPGFAVGTGGVVQFGNDGVPVPCFQPFADAPRTVGIVLQNAAVGGLGLIVAGGKGGGGQKNAAGILCALVRNFQQLAPPRGILRGGVGLPAFGKALQRLVRVGQRAHKAVQLQHSFAGGGIAASAVKQIGVGTKIRVLIGGFQYLGQRFLLDAGKVGFLGGFKVRRDVERGKVLLHKMQAECVHRADGCPLQQHLLAAQAGVFGVGAHLLAQTGGDVAAQLGGSRVGKGHDQQLVGVHGVVGVGDQPHHALDQHAGLAGACRGGHQQAAAPGADRRLLGGGKLDVRHRETSYSNGSAGMSGVRSFSPSV